MIATATFPPSKTIEKPTKNWTAYFLQNTQRWEMFSRNLSLDDVQLESEFITSIQTFQLGEQSEGKTLIALAARYAEKANNPAYLSAIRQFIGEEQRHAQVIAKALKANGIQPIEKQWTDGLFRKLRKLCGLEMMISVLLVAEIIAIAYYSTLSKACQEDRARWLFARILQDEATHLQFHGEQLHQFRKNRFSLRWTLHRWLLWSVTVLVWAEHRHVLKHQFPTFVQFFKRCDGLIVNLKN
ncbi:MAG: ferritin-like domain-containing protein [Cyanobacteria bacterium J06632_3]